MTDQRLAEIIRFHRTWELSPMAAELLGEVICLRAENAQVARLTVENQRAREAVRALLGKLTLIPQPAET